MQHNIFLQAFLSPLDGIIDAVSDAINAQRAVPSPDSRFGIQDSDGDALNTGRLLLAALRDRIGSCWCLRRHLKHSEEHAWYTFE